MNKKGITILMLVACFTLLSIPALAVTLDNRLFGADRYKTAEAIAEAYNAGTVDSVVLVPGNSYANALPASVLAYQKHAPILLLGETADQTTEAFEYLTAHLKKDGTIYLVGDSKSIGSDFTTKLYQMGYADVIRISGTDKYDTCRQIAQYLKVTAGTPLVISSGENFSDALAISGYAARMGYPIILVKPEGITDESLSFIQSIMPETIYITGGTGAIFPQVESQLKVTIPKATVQRFAGYDRFETAAQITDYFLAGKGVSDIYVTSGLNYPDALAGSVLVAKNQGAMVFVDPDNLSVPDMQSAFLRKLYAAGQRPAVNIFGGTVVVSENIVSNVKRLIQGQEQGQSELYNYLSIEGNRQIVIKRALQLNNGHYTNACVYFVAEALRRNGVDTPDATCNTLGLIAQLEDKGWTRSLDYKSLRPGDICFTTDQNHGQGAPAHTYVFMSWISPDNYDYAMICDNQVDRYGTSYHKRNIAELDVYKGEEKEPFHFFMRK